MRIDIEDPKDCGIGTWSCCAYLVSDASGFNCGRVYFSIADEMRKRVSLGLTNATRLPISEYPFCQEEGL